jgi:hypothetical protein
MTSSVRLMVRIVNSSAFAEISVRSRNSVMKEGRSTWGIAAKCSLFPVAWRTARATLDFWIAICRGAHAGAPDLRPCGNHAPSPVENGFDPAADPARSLGLRRQNLLDRLDDEPGINFRNREIPKD